MFIVCKVHDPAVVRVVPTLVYVVPPFEEKATTKLSVPLGLI